MPDSAAYKKDLSFFKHICFIYRHLFYQLNAAPILFEAKILFALESNKKENLLFTETKQNKITSTTGEKRTV